MQHFLIENALLTDGWAQSVLIEVDDDGHIKSVEPDAKSKSAGAAHVHGHVFPGIADLHSHAFQRAMAGLAERAGATNDSFWTWREVMYGFLEAIKPAHVEAIASQLYVELLKHGYTSVAEFHYLHHGPDGAPYGNLSEMSDRIIAASRHTGIGLCLLPVLYGFGGFGEIPPSEDQRRFMNKPERFLKLVEKLIQDHPSHRRLNIGMAAHSLRAVSPATLDAVLDGFDRLLPEAPIHIHIAEQVREVEDCLAWCGMRPVEFLEDRFDVDYRWCLIHATHLTDHEIDRIVRSDAVAGICPTTEANLGDGVFPARRYLEMGGRVGFGTDSHISVSLADDLRSFEYSQRLQHLGRNMLASPVQPSTGMNLLDCALRGGRAATGFNTAIEVGARADFVVLDKNHPSMIGRGGDNVIDSFVFANAGNPIRDVYVGGQKIVADGKHLREEKILTDFAATIRELQA